MKIISWNVNSVRARITNILDYIKQSNPDILFDKAVIDKQSLDIIAGSIIDFKKEMIGESFSIKNPKASASCGCGLSFSV